jgi:multiple antibiotic resistance protein
MDFMVFFLKALVVLFTMIDPVGLVPVTVGLTAGLSPHERARVATRATFIAAGVIAVFGVLGRFIFDWLQVTIQAFDIAGGALLFLVAIDMLFGRQSGARETAREQREARTREDVSVFPLAIPMIAGPGTITTIILLVGNAAPNPVSLLAIVVAAAITLTGCWVAMRLSVSIQARAGTSGILVLSRVLGMLLAAIAVQFILNGIALFMRTGVLAH